MIPFWLQVLLWIGFGVYVFGFVATFCFTFYVSYALSSLLGGEKPSWRNRCNIACDSFWKSLIWLITWRRVF